MVLSALEQSHVVSSGPWWYLVVPGDPWWSQCGVGEVVPGGQEQSQLVQTGPRWFPNGPKVVQLKWFQVVQIHVRCFKVALGGPIRMQVVSG